MSDKGSDVRLSSKYEALFEKAKITVDSVYDNSIFFTSDEYIYRLDFSSSHPNYISFNFSAFVDASRITPEICYEASNFVNSSIRYVKCFYEDDAVNLSCEQQIFDDAHFEQLLNNAVRVMAFAYHQLNVKFPDAV